MQCSNAGRSADAEVLDSSLVPVVIVIVIAVAHLATLADLLELAAALLGLATALAMFTNRVIQVLFRFLNLATAVVIAVPSLSRKGRSEEGEC
jgi:hypothetical protein